MPGELLTLADEVATRISGGTFAQPITATRRYVETTRLEDLAELRVEVIPQGTTRTRVARRAWTRQLTVLVGFQQQLPHATKAATADDLMTLSDSVTEFLESAEFQHGALLSIDELFTWNRDRYDKQHVFTRAILLTFAGRVVNHD